MDFLSIRGRGVTAGFDRTQDAPAGERKAERRSPEDLGGGEGSDDDQHISDERERETVQPWQPPHLPLQE
jgi:hypothetical protein